MEKIERQQEVEAARARQQVVEAEARMAQAELLEARVNQEAERLQAEAARLQEAELRRNTKIAEDEARAAREHREQAILIAQQAARAKAERERMEFDLRHASTMRAQAEEAEKYRVEAAAMHVSVPHDALRYESDIMQSIKKYDWEYVDEITASAPDEIMLAVLPDTGFGDAACRTTALHSFAFRKAPAEDTTAHDHWHRAFVRVIRAHDNAGILDLANMKGMTALMVACANGQTEQARMLISAGASIIYRARCASAGMFTQARLPI